MIAAMPLHDITGDLIKKILERTDKLESIYTKVIISLSPKTVDNQVKAIGKFKENNLYELVTNRPDSVVGEHFLAAYQKAAEKEEIVHLCTPDHLIYALDHYFDEIQKDLKSSRRPTLFTRSSKAWKTYPKNYFAIESMATDLGERLFGKKYDYFWCDLVLEAKTLKAVLAKVKRIKESFLFMAEIILGLKEELMVKEVDWTAWEDPYIFGKDEEEYKKERELAVDENEKRLNYVLPTIKFLLEQR